LRPPSPPPHLGAAVPLTLAGGGPAGPVGPLARPELVGQGELAGPRRCPAPALIPGVGAVLRVRCARVRADLPQPGSVAEGVATAPPVRGLAVAELGGEPGGGGHPPGSRLLGRASGELGRAECRRRPGLLAACLPPAARTGPSPGDRPCRPA